MRPDNVFDYRPPPRKMTDSELLNFIESRGWWGGEVVLEFDVKNRGWWVRGPVLIWGRSFRVAIDEYARWIGYRPPEPAGDPLATRFYQASIVFVSLLAAFLLVASFACPSHRILRESSVTLSCPPHRGSVATTATARPRQASRECALLPPFERERGGRARQADSPPKGES